MIHSEIDNIKFVDEDKAVLTGKNLPFKFAKIDRAQFTQGREALTIVVSRDRIMEEAVAQDPPPSFLTRLLSRYL